MRTTRTLLCVLFALGISLLGGNAVAANDSPFLGTWTSVDLDGSNQSLTISGGGSGNVAVSLYDDAATTACGGAPARFAGSGAVHGNDLVTTGAITCVPGGNPVRGRLSLDFHYDAATDTLTDFSGVVWRRS
jgi:hypothetical protein